MIEITSFSGLMKNITQLTNTSYEYPKQIEVSLKSQIPYKLFIGCFLPQWQLICHNNLFSKADTSPRHVSIAIANPFF